MEHQRIVIESPLKGNFARNRLYATWCCRHMHECGFSPIASHLVAPWFMDDRVEEERAAGIFMSWFWLPEVPHYFFIDLGMSGGMQAGTERCLELGIAIHALNRLPPAYMLSFERGEAPPHTPGFEIVGPPRPAPGYPLSSDGTVIG